MIYFISVLFGILIGLAGLAAAWYAMKKPETKLFGKAVSTERVMDVLMLLFIFLVIFVRSYLVPGDWQRVFWKGVIATVCVAAPAVLIIWLGYALLLRPRFPKNKKTGVSSEE